jgi:hypothetical protein
MKTLALAFCLSICLTITGCTALRPARTDHTSVRLNVPERDDTVAAGDCAPGAWHVPRTRDLKNVIEDYGTHLIGYVEYTDQGWEFDGKQRTTLLERLRADLADPERRDEIVVNLVFVHGWHHSAQDADCNVNEFRAAAQHVAAELTRAARSTGGQLKFRVNGIYIGWRGESLTVPLLRNATLFGRRTAAEHVAKGAVRELFADLRRLELDERAQAGRAGASGGGGDRVRTIVIGHSFGALIAFHSLSQSLLNDLSMRAKAPGAEPDCGAPDPVRAWPDFTVLINPAFEASRFEPIHNTARRVRACPGANERPKLIVVTADNDGATGRAFPLFRSVASIFEEYDPSSPATSQAERDANLHAIGFVDRYRTHHLSMEQEAGASCIRLSPAPGAGGVQVSRYDPVLVVNVPPTIVNGHDGFLYPAGTGGDRQPVLLNWLLDVYLDSRSPNSVRDRDLHRLSQSYRRARCADHAAAGESG